MRETVANRFRRHRLQPQTARRLFHPAPADGVAKDQLAFAARVTGIDDLRNVRPLRQLV